MFLTIKSLYHTPVYLTIRNCSCNDCHQCRTPVAGGHSGTVFATCQGFLRLLSVLAQIFPLSQTPRRTLCFFYSPKSNTNFHPNVHFSPPPKFRRIVALQIKNSAPKSQFLYLLPNQTLHFLSLLPDQTLHFLSPCFVQLHQRSGQTLVTFRSINFLFLPCK